jgi:error-prone DNA polymerase
MSARNEKLFSSIDDLRRIGLTDSTLEKLADADTFRSIDHNRREALWEVSTKDYPEALFSGQRSYDNYNERIILPEMSLSEHVVHDYATTSLSIKAHPVSFIREQLDRLHVLSSAALASRKDGDTVKVAGLILVRQRPGTASGICFITIEDETGTSNLVVFQKLFDQYRKEIIQSRLLMVEGKLQIEGEVVHVIVKRCYNLSRLLRELIPASEDVPSLGNLSRADERGPAHDERVEKHDKQVVQGRIFGEGRNFR